MGYVSKYGHAMLAEASRERQGEPCVKQLPFAQGSRTEQFLVSYVSLKMITCKENQGGRVRKNSRDLH